MEEGEGGGGHKCDFFIGFLDVLGYTDHFKRPFFSCTKLIILVEWPDTPLARAKKHFLLRCSLELRNGVPLVLRML